MLLGMFLWEFRVEIANSPKNFRNIQASLRFGMTEYRDSSRLYYTVTQIKRGHFSFRHNFYSC